MPTSPRSDGPLEYRPSIDGLRALAVLSVFIFHLNHRWLPGGFLGVDIFFVISGYLITAIICKQCKEGSFSLAKFYQRRIARIFPASVTVALMTLLGAACIYSPQELSFTGSYFLAAMLSAINFMLIFKGSYFHISPDTTPFLHFWSLAVEEQFYVFFPLLFLLLFKYARRHQVLLLSLLWTLSFVACVGVTHRDPSLAFYLLPTRAWELLAGCTLAVVAAQPRYSVPMWSRWSFITGLGLVLLSLVFIPESSGFPGWYPLFPVAGTVLMLLPSGVVRVAERWLTAPPLVFVGQISYSLYLWHWPVFSLVDYHLFLAPAPLRLALKIGLSFAAAVLSFYFIERTTRGRLNQRSARPVAYAFALAIILISVPLGLWLRRENYVNAKLSDVAKGGLVYAAKHGTSSVMLMGDSNGSMYGNVMRDICKDADSRLTVISVGASDPMPTTDATQSRLWLESLAVVKREKPDCLVLVCSWAGVLHDDTRRLDAAITALQPLVGHLVLLTQPPKLPLDDPRSAIRDGASPVFYENADYQQLRMNRNQYVTGFDTGCTYVVDIASVFQKTDGSILFLDERARQMYFDAGHLSVYGSDRIRPQLEQAIFHPKH